MQFNQKFKYRNHPPRRIRMEPGNFSIIFSLKSNNENNKVRIRERLVSGSARLKSICCMANNKNRYEKAFTKPLVIDNIGFFLNTSIIVLILTLISNITNKLKAIKKYNIVEYVMG
jgi:hypothetical protein